MSERAYFQQAHFVMMIAAVMGFLLLNLENEFELNWNLYAFFTFFVGLVLVFRTYKIKRLFITPLQLFSVIWMILVPLTSMSVPLMGRMSCMQWQYVFTAVIFYSLGGIGATFVIKKKNQSEITSAEFLHVNTYKICVLIIFWGIALTCFQAYVAGGFPLFKDNIDAARRSFYLPQMALLSNVSIPAIFVIFCDARYRRKKLFLLGTIVFVALQILLGVRFLAFIVVIMMLAIYGNVVKNKDVLKKIFRLFFVALCIFFIVASFRGGTSDKERIFVDSGIYNGSAETLARTEIIRYFGMSQRTMEKYISFYEPAYSKMILTLSPVLSLVGFDFLSYSPPHFGIYGYTATNIIAYFYFDAGHLWVLMMFFWAFLMNYFYFSYKSHPNSIMHMYWWGVAATCLTLSFYCYVDAFPYWFCAFPLLIWFINKLNIFFKKRGL